jgi:hypothetical protein
MRTVSWFPARLLVCAIAVLSASGLLQADMVIQQKHRTLACTTGEIEVPASEWTSTMWLGKDRARIDRSADSSIIIRLDRNMMYVVRYKTKTYIREPIEPGKENVLSAIEDDGDMTVVNFKLPEVTMNVSFPGAKAARKKKIRNWNCRKYRLSYSINGIGAKSTLWATNDVKIDYASYNRITFAFLNKMNGCTAVYRELEKIKGLPVMIETLRQIKGATVKSREEILDVREEVIPPGTYDIPQGYIRTGR